MIQLLCPQASREPFTAHSSCFRSESESKLDFGADHGTDENTSSQFSQFSSSSSSALSSSPERTSSGPTPIIPGVLYLGSVLDAHNERWLEANGVSVIVNAAKEIVSAAPKRNRILVVGLSHKI